MNAEFKWTENLKLFVVPMSLGHVALLTSSQPQAKIKVEKERWFKNEVAVF